MKKLIDNSMIEPPIQANDCSEILNNSQISKNEGRNKTFIVCTNDEIIQEEIYKMKRELHKERQRNAELWSSNRKNIEQLKNIHAEYENTVCKGKKQDFVKNNWKSMIEKQKNELNENEKNLTELKEQTIKVSKERQKLDDILKKTSKLNNIFQGIIKKMLESPLLKKNTIEAMKSLNLIPASMKKSV